MNPKYLLTAIGFLTRIPMPAWVPFDPPSVAKATRWFALVGLLIGGLGAYLLAQLAPIVGQSLAVVLVLVALWFITGGFHEDGLADLCDGFWGGWQRERKLAIMKDSMIGTYGVLALIGATAIKLVALSEMHLGLACLSLVIAHSAGRAAVGWIPAFLPYARVVNEQGDNSKTPQRLQVPAYSGLMLLMFTAAIPMAWLPVEAVYWLLGMLGATFVAMVWLMHRHIQGYTGDTLGATEQVFELVTLTTLLGLMNQGYL